MRIKALYSIILFAIALSASAQVKISELPTYNIMPSHGWISIVVGTTTYKLDVSKLPKLDSIYSRNDSLFSIKNAQPFFIRKFVNNTLTKVSDSVYLIGTDSLIIHNNGSTGGGGNVDQNTKDTSVTFTGAATFADIPSGITYTPADIAVSITSATSSAGDTGQGFTYSFNNTTHILRILYGVAPIGTFTYHIVFTKVTIP